MASYEELYGSRRDRAGRPYNLRGSRNPYFNPPRYLPSGTASVPSLLGSEFPSDRAVVPSSEKYTRPGYEQDMRKYESDIARGDKAAAAAARGETISFYKPGEQETTKVAPLTQRRKDNLIKRWIAETGLTKKDLPITGSKKNVRFDYALMDADVKKIREIIPDSIRKAIDGPNPDHAKFAKKFRDTTVKSYLKDRTWVVQPEADLDERIQSREGARARGELTPDEWDAIDKKRGKLPGRLGAAAGLLAIPGLVKAGSWGDVGGILSEAALGADVRDFAVIPEGSVERSKDWWKNAFGLLTSPITGLDRTP